MSKELMWQVRLHEESAFLDITVPYSNETNEEKHLVFEYKLTYGADIIAAGKKEIIALPNYSSAAHILLSIYHPALFTLEKPELYSLTVKEICNGMCERTIVRQVTFKDYKIKEGISFLNGKAIFIRAMRINPFVEKTESCFTNNMYYRAAYKAKEYGFHAIVVECPSLFLKEVAEKFGLLVLQPEDLPKTTDVYAEKNLGADVAMELQVQQAIKLCESYNKAVENVLCGGFCVEDYAVFDEYARPTVAIEAIRALSSEENKVYLCVENKNVYAFTKADSCQGYVNGHPTAKMEKIVEGVFKSELPDDFVQYSVVTTMVNKKDSQVILNPMGKAVQVLFKADTSRRNIDCDAKDMVPVTAYAIDENGNMDVNYKGDARFVPYSSAIIRGKTDFTQDVGIGSDKYGNVVMTEGGSQKEMSDYIIPFKAGKATVLLSAKNNSRFTGITVFTEFGSKTEYLDY